jgi:hypothetical protein
MVFTFIPIERKYPLKILKLFTKSFYRHLLREGKIIDGKIRKELGL